MRQKLGTDLGQAKTQRPTAGCFAPQTFTWVLGIEDTCVFPPDGFPMDSLDELALTGDRENWKEDLDLVKQLGATAVRYGADWPLVHLGWGQFDWEVLDQRLRYAASLGLTVVADLVHYGTPTWLEGSFVDPLYPQAIAEFARAFAERYRGVVDYYTPFNEPVTTASFCGLRGIWPPGLTSWEGWARVILGVARGVQESVRAIRAANPGAVIVQVEASSLYSTDEPQLTATTAELMMLGMVPTDLMLGLVSPQCPAYQWLIDHGAQAGELASLQQDGVTFDILGVNYYPDLSPRRLTARSGEVQQVAYNGWKDGLVASVTSFWERYHLPIVITETSIEGSDSLRSSWLHDCSSTVQELIVAGLDIRGLTWWPLLDFVDWSYASSGRNVEEFELPAAVVERRRLTGSKEPYLRHMGLVSLHEEASGQLIRQSNESAEVFARESAFHLSV